MNNELHSLILSNAREKVAKQYAYISWEALMQSTHRGQSFSKYHTEATLLLAQELSGFYRWASRQWLYIEKCELWNNTFEPALTDMKTEQELYTQYLNEKKDADK